MDLIVHVFPTAEDISIVLDHRIGCGSKLQGRDSLNFNLFASVTSAGLLSFSLKTLN